MTPEELLEVYDDQVRGSFADRLPPGWSGERDGPLTRCLTGRAGFAMLTGPAEGLSVTELGELIERTMAYFGEQGRWFEWKTYDHDPPTLRPLLLERNATPEPHEALLLGEAAALTVEPALPEELTLRAASSRGDFERIAAMQSAVWGEDWSWLAEDLALRVQADPPTVVLLVEDGDLAVSAGWLTPFAGTSVAGL